MDKNNIPYPIRVNRYLYLNNICSRREADRLISQKKVWINNRLAVLGDKINKNDEIRIEKQTEKRLKNKIYLAYYKPEGLISDKNEGKSSIETKLNIARKEKLFPVGRLDKNSSGLIILTNDGTIIDHLLNPKNHKTKGYVVEVDKKIDDVFIKRMEKGVDIGDGKTKTCKIEKIEAKKLKITLTEGRNHQIKRMADRLGYTVRKIKRVKFANISLGNLKPGEYREIKGKELKKLLDQH
jgi:23S rRNA pseudouridine2604 synthase